MMNNRGNDVKSKLDIILKFLSESVKYCSSHLFFKDKINITSDAIVINGFKIEKRNYKTINWIIIGKCVLSLLEFLKSFIDINEKFNIIALIPDKIASNLDFDSNKITIYKGNHPIPSEKSFQSTLKIINSIKSLEKEDLVIFFIGGGTSSLFSYPNDELTLEEFSQIWSMLLYSDLKIQDINKYRGFIDQVKKGGINLFTKAEVVSFYLSDVVGDDLSTIGSGPTIVDTTRTDLSENVEFINRLDQNLQKKMKYVKNLKREEKKASHASLLISQRDFGKILFDLFEKNDKKALYHLYPIKGNFKTVCTSLIDFFINNPKNHHDIFHIWSGESVVELPDTKKSSIGGRNQHLLLYLYKLWINNILSDALLVTFSTDGIDGNSPYAGGWIYTKDVNIKTDEINTFLENFISSAFLKPNNVIQTGSTGINFADIILIYVFK